MTRQEIEALLVDGINNVEFIEALPATTGRNLRAYHYLRDREGRIRVFRYFLRRNVLIAPGVYCLRKRRETYEEYILRHETDWTPEELKEAV